jgi:hypothetical protein
MHYECQLSTFCFCFFQDVSNGAIKDVANAYQQLTFRQELDGEDVPVAKRQALMSPAALQSTFLDLNLQSSLIASASPSSLSHHQHHPPVSEPSTNIINSRPLPPTTITSYAFPCNLNNDHAMNAMNDFAYLPTEWIPNVIHPSSSGVADTEDVSTMIHSQQPLLVLPSNNKAVPEPVATEHSHVTAMTSTNQPTSSGASNTVGPSVSRYHCSLCSFYTERACRINLHLKSHGKAGSILCTCCGASYRSLKGYTSHLSNCQKIENNSVIPAPEIFAETFPAVDLQNIAPALALQLSGQYRVSKSAQDMIFANLATTTRVLHEILTRDDSLDQLEQFSTMCEKLSNVGARDDYVRQFFQLPVPESVKIGTKEAYYFPFKNLLSLLLRLPEMKDFVISPQIGSTDEMHDFNNGRLVAHFASGCLLFSLYADDFCICNPLGQARTKHKLLIFYVQVLNVPPKYRSKVASVFPLAIANAKSLRPNLCLNLSKLLRDFTDTMKMLSTDGIVFNVCGKSTTLKGHLVAFIGDSLAANALGGFKEGFSEKVKRCCRACNSTRVEMKISDLSSQCSLRSKDEHEKRVAELQKGFLTKKTYAYWSKEYGITGDSVFAAIPEFNLTKAMLFDPMHDVLEGIFPLQMELMLEAHVGAKIYDVHTVNLFLLHAPVPGNDRPNFIANDMKIVSKQTAGQMLSLMRILPFFFAERLPENHHDEHWNCMMHLLRILQFCLSPVMNDIGISHLRKAISDHHVAYMQLYPDGFIPKLHFLVHYPDQASNFGPLRNHMCFTFEAKHQMAKNIRWFNFKNIPLSIMNHAITDLAANLFQPSGEPRNDVFRSSVAGLRHGARRAVLNGVNYKVSDVLMLSEDESSGFVQIMEFELAAGNRLQLNVRQLKTKFVKGFNLFEVQETSSSSFSCFADQLLFPWPVLQYTSTKWQIFPIALGSVKHFYRY